MGLGGSASALSLTLLSPLLLFLQYGNNCICSDHCSGPECYQGDVDATLDYGFDSIKLDGCGTQRDLTLYARLFNQTGKAILIENCHWGGTVPNATWCPWNYFRTSGDVRAKYDSIVGNLQTTIQWAKTGLSAPGCWGYVRGAGGARARQPQAFLCARARAHRADRPTPHPTPLPACSPTCSRWAARTAPAARATRA